ncbi:hypothetical protein J6590_091058 [Homalodisca vitripennis]|nr:hypothetical protein J6590_091058 [Homalodisca vitripennis]
MCFPKVSEFEESKTVSDVSHRLTRQITLTLMLSKIHKEWMSGVKWRGRRKGKVLEKCDRCRKHFSSSTFIYSKRGFMKAVPNKTIY